MKITCQGVPGAYSQIAAAEVFPGQTYVACESFEQAAALVRDGSADRAVLPIENSNAGRVTGMHKLLPSIGLYIQGEYFLRVEHQLLGLPAATPQNIVCAVSHPQALAQYSLFLQQHNIAPVAGIGTAKSCEDVLAAQDPGKAAIASKAAAEIYGLKILQANIENDSRNATRFLLLSRQNLIPHDDRGSFYNFLHISDKTFSGRPSPSVGSVCRTQYQPDQNRKLSS